MANPYLEYYRSQSGGSLPYFEGHQFVTRGGSFFGRMFKGILQPLLAYLGKKALSTAVATGQDVLEGKPFKESARSHIAKFGQEVTEDAFRKLSQSGKGLSKRPKGKRSGRHQPRILMIPPTRSQKRKQRGSRGNSRPSAAGKRKSIKGKASSKSKKNKVPRLSSKDRALIKLANLHLN